jgi:hypothetical protein
LFAAAFAPSASAEPDRDAAFQAWASEATVVRWGTLGPVGAETGRWAFVDVEDGCAWRLEANDGRRWSIGSSVSGDGTAECGVRDPAWAPWPEPRFDATTHLANWYTHDAYGWDGSLRLVSKTSSVGGRPDSYSVDYGAGTWHEEEGNDYPDERGVETNDGDYWYRSGILFVAERDERAARRRAVPLTFQRLPRRATAEARATVWRDGSDTVLLVEVDDDVDVPVAADDERSLVRADHVEVWWSDPRTNNAVQVGVGFDASGAAVIRSLVGRAALPTATRDPDGATLGTRWSLRFTPPHPLAAESGPGSPMHLHFSVAYSDSDDPAAGQQSLVASGDLRYRDVHSFDRLHCCGLPEVPPNEAPAPWANLPATATSP